ncbi:MAG: phosphoglycerate dehydrogenase [Anaerolineales bacterium]|nr:phosphoglycerate dehydrogenase [Anaerolineales bacterium]
MMRDLKSCRVLVTPRSFGQSDPRMKDELETAVNEVIYNPTQQPLTSKQLRGLLADCDGYIAGLDHIDRDVLEHAPRLKVIARYGVGVDKVDLDAAQALGIVVTNTPAANATSVAELTLGLMLSLARQIPAANSAMHNGEWPRYRSVALAGKTVGLLGLGMIGKEVARRLQGFDCTIIAHDPFPDHDFCDKYGVTLLPLDEVASRADFLSLHVPLLPSTRTIVNASFIAHMKRGAYVINTSRGELVDESALYDGLVNGRLAGAALDVFTVEPPASDHPLLTLPQVIATPHIGAHSDSATNAMGWTALRDCLAVLSGEEPTHRVV